MTEQTDVPDVMPEQEIEFHGRMIWVRMPRPEQLLVWKRTLVQLQDADPKDWNAEQVMNSLERLRKILDSLLVHRTDIDWIDDEMLANRLTFKTLAPIVTLTVEAFQTETNRETRRAAKKAAPAKKAARKKATPR